MHKNDLRSKLFKFLKKPLLIDIIILIVLIFSINNFIVRDFNTIKSDGMGYYDYLPSTFIHGDINRKDHTKESNPQLYERVNQIICYVNYDDKVVNKYPVGTAILQSPFFYFTYLKHGKDNSLKDGYQDYYHKSIYHATLFYAFLAIVFMRMLLSLYNVKRHVIIICQLLVLLGTSVMNYVHYDASFSHVYSFFAITAFLYFTKVFFIKKQFKYFLWACLFLSLIVVLRQINGLILFFVPFLAGSFKELKEVVLLTFKNYKKLILGLVLFSLVVSIQLIVWYLQTGSLVVYSYPGEGFNWSKPEMYNILFSYRKGLFVYTPVLFICLFGLVWFIYKKKYYLLFTWLGFFLFLTYVFSSWWSWWYGGSYGLRAYIDYYTIFFIPFALLLNNLRLPAKILIVALASLTIPVNFIQTYQYKKYILHWDDMNKEKYWKVFLKKHPKYNGLLWKKRIEKSQHNLEKQIFVGDISIAKGEYKKIEVTNFVDLPNYDKISTIQVVIDHNFNESIDTRIGLDVTDHYFYEAPLIHFAEKGFNEFQEGYDNFHIDPVENSTNKKVSITIYAEESLELQNVRVKFFSRKQQ
jgi:hypothetical protein